MKRTLSIAFLLTQDLESPSGLGRYYPLAKELARLGHRVTILALHPNFKSLETKKYEQDGVGVWYVGPMHVKKQKNHKSYYPSWLLVPLVLKALWALSRAILGQSPDIIHIGKPHPMNGVAGLLFKGLRKGRVFLDCDDFEAGSTHFSGKWQKWVITLFENTLPGYMDHITANTFFNLDRLRSLGIPSNKITYLPNGVDLGRFGAVDVNEVEGIRSELGLVGRKVIAFIGTLSLTNHPVNLLLDAFAIIEQKQGNAVLLLVGGGEDYRLIVELAKKKGIDRKVRFVGRIHPSRVPCYYRLADVSVDPVYDDDAARGRSPLKMFESWVMGVPFITGDVGDRRNMFGDPPAGILTSPGNSEGLAEALTLVLSDFDLANTLSRRGFERVRNFYWDQLVQIIERIYEKYI